MEPILKLVFSAGCAFAVSLVVLLVMLRYSDRVPHDHPNHRSLHDKPIPIVGGVAIMIAVFVSSSIFAIYGLRTVLFLMMGLSFLIFMISVVDDTRRLSVKIRLLVQMMVATAFVWKIVSPPGPLMFALAVFAIVWSMNLYNFMDGIDGLAGGMSLFGFGFLAFVAWRSGAYNLAILSVTLASASSAFLIFNFAPAKVFLGDGGAVPMGFLVAGVSLIGMREGLWPLWFPVLVFSPFIWDSTVSLLRRVVKREPFWLPHNGHYYQRAIRMGWSHRAVTLVEWAIMLAAGTSAVLMLDVSMEQQVFAGLVWGLAYVILSVWLDRRWAKASGS